MKLCNLASLDPVQRARGVKGLEGAAKQDREMWNEFQANLPTLGPVSEQELHNLFTENDDLEVDFLGRDKVRLEPRSHHVAPGGPTETTATVKVRRGQQFFRQSILTAYNVRCCISGINVPRLLVASHIKPWRDFPAVRLDPRNGLCLSSLHDAAFDSFMITLDEKLKVVLSKRLKKFFPNPVLEQSFAPFEGQKIHMPDKLAEPSQEYLSFHRKKLLTMDHDLKI